MSLGLTDKFWWIKNASCLLNNEGKILLINSYDTSHSLLSSRIVKKKRNKKEDEFIFHLDDLNLTDEKTTQLRSQIYIITNSENILNISLKDYIEVHQ